MSCKNCLLRVIMFSNFILTTSWSLCGYWVGNLCFNHPLHSTLGSQVLGASWQEFHREEESSTSEKNQGKFVPSEKVMQLRKKLIKFIEDHIYPMEAEFYKHAQSTSRWTIHPEEENLKALARKEGLWNLFIPVCFTPFETLRAYIIRKIRLIIFLLLMEVRLFCSCFIYSNYNRSSAARQCSQS